LTELWLSAVRTSRERRSNGYASPTSRQAPVAFGVKIAAYSSGDAFRYRSTARRADSTSAVDAADVGFSECGLPKTPARRRFSWARTWLSAASPEPA
jgi:hypothetical protein